MKYCVMKHLILRKIQNVMDVNVDLVQWSTNISIKKTSGSGTKNVNIFHKELAKKIAQTNY